MKTLMYLFISVVFTICSLNVTMASDVGGIMIDKGMINGIAYASGGISKEERGKMESMAKDYNLQLSFALTSKPYLSEVATLIRDKDGKLVFDKVSNGPWLFVKLPAGEYELVVTHNNQKETRKVTIGKELKKIEFDWKS